MSIDTALERWLRRTRIVSQITWYVVASLLTLGLLPPALGLIDWSPALAALVPERTQELLKALPRP